MEYTLALKLSPNRLNGLLSAGLAAEETKRPEEARAFDAEAARQTNFGKTSERPELVHAMEVAGTTETVAAGR